PFDIKEESEGELFSPAHQINRALILRTQGELKTWQDRYRSYSTLLSQIDTSVSPTVERGIIEAELQRYEAKLNDLFERLYLQQATLHLTSDTKKRKQARNYLDVTLLQQHISLNRLLLAYFLYREKLVI